MKLNNTINDYKNNVQPTPQKKDVGYFPSFKAGAGFSGTLDMLGRTMQGIEDGGFLASFLIQDMLGMTAPRVGAAFLRDKEVTGEYNIQEGFEVLGREGLTGPCMMAVAPITFALASKFGKSTSSNTQLIKRFGNSLKEILASPNFDKSLLNNKEKFKQEFYNINIKQMLENTLEKSNFTDDSVKYIMEQISKYENIPADAVLPKNIIGLKSKSKYKKQCLANIAEHINNIKYTKSSDLSMLDSVKVGAPNDLKTFATKDTIEAMIKYSDDAIYLNKNLNKLNELKADDIKNSAIAKRFITNIATIASTLGVLAILPKLYIRSNVAPGARTAMQLKEKQRSDKELNNKDKNVSFKGGRNPNKSWLSKFGKKLEKFFDNDFAGRELEYNGHNFTNTLMAGLSIFGLLTPRGLKAYNRAQTDENGKKDLTELYEILIRDISSSLAVVFAVPMLTRAAVTSYENQSGFVLMHKDRTKSKLATMFDLINPYSKAHVLTNSEINSLYNKIDSKEKMVNFCKYINENGGDLHKILSKSEHANTIFNEKAINIDKITKLSKQEKNDAIKKFFENLGADGKLDKKGVNEFVSKLMKGGINKPKTNKILSFARGLNSVPGIITTFLISPYLLGWFIPRLTYANTRRIHEKAEKEKENKVNTAA